MREGKGNVWDLLVPGDVLCITTNGFVKANGEAVMGRGIAYEATQRDPLVARALGEHIANNGNHVGQIHQDADYIWLSFPVKHHWHQDADPELIARSARELLDHINTVIDKDHNGPEGGWVWVPQPGTGNGRLSWADVKPLIAPILDDRFIAVTW